MSPCSGLHCAFGWSSWLSAVGFIALCGWLASRMGSEFIPSLDEGDLAVQALRIPGTSLTQSLEMQFQLERALKDLPEVKTFFARVGTAEVATDPMPPSISDGYVMLKDRSEWPNPDKTKAELLEEIEERLASLPGNAYEISQPIELRFNELISGVRSDLGIKVFGDDLDQLLALGNAIARVLNGVAGAEGVKVEQVEGLPVLSIEPESRRAVSLRAQRVGRADMCSPRRPVARKPGQLFEGDQRFASSCACRNICAAISRRSSVCRFRWRAAATCRWAKSPTLKLAPGPNQISRENGKRRLVVTSNVRGPRSRRLRRRSASSEGRAGGEAAVRLLARVRRHVRAVAVGDGATDAARAGDAGDDLRAAADDVRIGEGRALVFSGVPLALTGGVIALWLRDIPLSITAGVGFITLSGVAVLTGVVMVSAFRDRSTAGASIDEAIREGAMLRLRPILMVALVAALGFLPMALNTGTGAEVQRPLATVID